MLNRLARPRSSLNDLEINVLGLITLQHSCKSSTNDHMVRPIGIKGYHIHMSSCQSEFLQLGDDHLATPGSCVFVAPQEY